MRWEWDDSGDNRVVDLWYLREKLFSSGKVAYAKWFERRATFFSKDLFSFFLRALNPSLNWRDGLSKDSLRALQILEDNSPLSTKELRAALGFQGRAFEADYHRALSTLWSRLLIVGCGEVDDGAFPSLAIGATTRIFEKEFQKSRTLSTEVAVHEIIRELGKESTFVLYLERLMKKAATLSQRRALPISPKKRRWIGPEDLS